MTRTHSHSNLRIALLGGEGLRSQSASLWDAMRSLAGINESHLAVLPVALSSHPLSQFERRTDITRKQLSEFGFTTTLLSPDELAPSINGTNIVYLPGGDQRAVVQSLQSTKLWHSLLAPSSSVKLLIASGGAAVALGDRSFAPVKPYPASLDELEFEMLSGLGLLPNLIILPYFSWLQDEVLSKIRALAPESVLLGIDDQAVLVSDPTGWHVMGLGIVSVFHPNDKPHIFDPGAQVPPSILAPFP